jgi:PKD repeat protein
VPTSWLWDFGDSITSRHVMNATHTFTNPVTYNITLTVTNAAGNNSVARQGYIKATVTSSTGKPAVDFYHLKPKSR